MQDATLLPSDKVVRVQGDGLSIDTTRPFTNPDDEVVRDILAAAHRIAVVGLSNRPDRPSYGVAAYLQRQGYEIVPVNPNVARVLGVQAYRDLRDVPFRIDVVDVFRRSETVVPVAEAAAAIGATVLWLQEGIINLEAADIAHRAGLTVVMDRCMAVEHARLVSKD